jgi:FtsZ-binding cell division protein ZapB
MERTINVQIPIYNPNLFKNTFAFKSDTLILSKKINDQEDVNEEQAVQITSNTYSTTNRLNSLYIANATVSNTNFSHLSGLTSNIESTFISNINNINVLQTDVNNLQTNETTQNTNITNLQTDVNNLQTNETTQNTNIANLQTNINSRLGYI